MNVSLIGGGITNSLITFLLRNTSHRVDIWESNSELGGRMKTLKTLNFKTGLDLGAQYISTSSELRGQHDEIYSFLLKTDALRSLNCEIINMKPTLSQIYNYVAPEGTSSLVQRLVESNADNIFLSHSVSALNVSDQNVEVISDERRKKYEIVVLTLPIPWFLKLKGNFKDCISDTADQKMRNVTYSKRYCLILLFSYKLPVTWGAKYIPDDPIFRYVGIQENKIGVTHIQSSVIFHSSVEFEEMYRNNDKEMVKMILMERVKLLFPEWDTPDVVAIHEWDCSQVIKPYESTPGSIVIRDKPLIILAGDGFTASNFNGCIASAKSAVNLIQLYSNITK